MGLFTTRTRPTPDRAEARAEQPAALAAVREALASDPGPRPGAATLAACAVAGKDLARDGVPLEQALDGLRSAWRARLRRDPPYAAVRALGAAWGEQTLGHLHQLGCEDPLSGLGSLSHLRSRLAELYRAQGAAGREVADHHALLVLDSPEDPVAPHPDGAVGASLRTARLAEAARTVFTGGETFARVSRERVAVLVERDDRLTRRLGLVRALVATVEPPVRVWVDALPAHDDQVGRLLEELARRR